MATEQAEQPTLLTTCGHPVPSWHRSTWGVNGHVFCSLACMAARPDTFGTDCAPPAHWQHQEAQVTSVEVVI